VFFAQLAQPANGAADPLAVAHHAEQLLADDLLCDAQLRRDLGLRKTVGEVELDDLALAHGETRLWGEVVDAEGRRVAARMRGPQAYRWTALTALDAVEGLLAGGVEPGFRTFAGAFGPDAILRHGVEREDLE